MRSWNQKVEEFRGRVVLRGDIVKDDPGAYALFSELGSSSASQMTAAKIMDAIARFPGCDGQAADAVSGSAQVKMEDAPRLLKIPKSECPDIRIRFHDVTGQHRGQTLKIQWFLLNEICTDVHSLVSCEKQFEEVLLELGWEKGTEMGMSTGCPVC